MTDPIPPGHSTLTPNIVVEGGQEALDFYTRAFGGTVVLRLDMGDKLMHGEVQIGDSVLSVSDPFPDHGFVAPDGDATSQSLSIWVEDCDAVHARAVAAGATELSAPADQFHGDRVGTLRCPYGHRWIIASRIREMTQDEMQEAMEEAFGG
jgi:PhnB protein